MCLSHNSGYLEKVSCFHNRRRIKEYLLFQDNANAIELLHEVLYKTRIEVSIGSYRSFASQVEEDWTAWLIVRSLYKITLFERFLGVNCIAWAMWKMINLPWSAKWIKVFVEFSYSLIKIIRRVIARGGSTRLQSSFQCTLSWRQRVCRNKFNTRHETNYY